MPAVQRSPITLPIPEISLPDFILQCISKYGDKVAQECAITGRSVTFAQMKRDILTIAARMNDFGFKKGQAGAVIVPNCIEYARIFYGIAKAGGAVTTINVLYTPEEIKSQLLDSKAVVLFTLSSFLDRVGPAIDGTSVKIVVLIDKPGLNAATIPNSSAMIIGVDQLLIARPGDDKRVYPTVNPSKDVVALPYSSGTTGKNKGVMLSHRNIVSNLLAITAIDGASTSDVAAGVLPFFHIFGMVVVMGGALVKGMKNIVFPRFELPLFLSKIQSEKISVAYLVPPILLALAKDPSVANYDLGSLHTITSGAAPLGKDLAEAVFNRLKGRCTVRQGYGMSELSPVTHFHLAGCTDMRYPASGQPIPNQEVKIIDLETGKDIEESSVDRQGEICVRGPNVFLGYLGNEKATKETVDSDGWLHTGDIGYQDKDGYLFVLDRQKELIKVKGYQVAPAELEAHLLAHDAVADCAVIGVPDDEAGEAPKAFVVLKQGVKCTDADLIKFVASHTAPYKKIRHLEFIQAIPKSPSGKILRRILVQAEAAKRAAAAAASSAGALKSKL